MIGRSLGHYRITAAIGAGGMGEVYRATDTKLGRDVALKLLPAEMEADPERLDRFQREARALAALDHPGIVSVFSVEESDGIHFLTMQLVLCILRVWQWQRKRMRTGRIQKQPVWETLNPALSTPQLIRGSPDAATQPAGPVQFGVSGSAKVAVLVGEDYQLVAEYYEQVANFFPLELGASTLVSVNGRIAPQGWKRTSAKLAEVSLGRRYPLSPDD